MKEGVGSAAIERIIQGLQAIEKRFDAEKFREIANAGLHGKELKERINHVIDCLVKTLPPFKIFAPKLKKLPQHWDYGNPDDSLKGFAAWPIIDYVAVAGIQQPQLAFECFEKITHLFSAEFAIRPFIEQYPKESFEQLLKWAEHPDEHVRRLASEGCRPRLPWGIQLKALIKNPQPILPILEKLKSDSSKYVQKSVANNLNDLSKDHAELVIQICRDWQKDNNTNTDWIVKHACRTLIKAGNKECLALFGATPAKLTNCTILCPGSVKMGDEIIFTFKFSSTKTQDLIIDFAIGFHRANGALNKKVFKLAKITTTKNEWVSLSKTYSFKPITTRKYYKGPHTVSLQVNGAIVCEQNFSLI